MSSTRKSSTRTKRTTADRPLSDADRLSVSEDCDRLRALVAEYDRREADLRWWRSQLDRIDRSDPRAAEVVEVVQDGMREAEQDRDALCRGLFNCRKYNHNPLRIPLETAAERRLRRESMVYAVEALQGVFAREDAGALNVCPETGHRELAATAALAIAAGDDGKVLTRRVHELVNDAEVQEARSGNAGRRGSKKAGAETAVAIVLGVNERTLRNRKKTK